jgi:hypothetical protein
MCVNAKELQTYTNNSQREYKKGFYSPIHHRTSLAAATKAAQKNRQSVKKAFFYPFRHYHRTSLAAATKASMLSASSDRNRCMCA